MGLFDFVTGGISQGGDDLGGLLFGGNWNPPEYQKPTLTQGTTDAVEQVAREGQRSPEQLKAKMLSGVGNYRGLIKSGGQLGQEQSAMGDISSSAQNEALSNKAQRSYGQALASLQRRAPEQAQMMAAQRQVQASKVLQARDKWNLNVSNADIQSILNQQASRAAVLSSITGGIGAVVGGIFGGPAGAKAGAKAGSSASGAAGAQDQAGDINTNSDYSGDYLDMG